MGESGGNDSRKRLMVVPDCHVMRLITDGSGPIRRVVGVETNRGTVPVPEEAAVVIALGTIESARLATLVAARIVGRSAQRRQFDAAFALEPDDPRTAGRDRRA